MAKNKEFKFLAQGTYHYIIIALSLSWLFLVVAFNDNIVSLFIHMPFIIFRLKMAKNTFNFFRILRFQKKPEVTSKRGLIALAANLK